MRVPLRGGAVWQLVGLITRRSQVQILPPLPAFRASRKASMEAFFDGGGGPVEAHELRASTPKSSCIGQGPIGPLVVSEGLIRRLRYFDGQGTRHRRPASPDRADARRGAVGRGIPARAGRGDVAPV